MIGLETLISKISVEMFGLVFKGALAFYIVIMVKNIVTALKDYTLFMTDKDVSINTPVIYDGFEGVISKIGLFYLIIEGKKGYMKVSISRWMRYGTPIYKYPQEFFNNREMKKEDIDEEDF